MRIKHRNREDKRCLIRYGQTFSFKIIHQPKKASFLRDVEMTVDAKSKS